MQHPPKVGERLCDKLCALDYALTPARRGISAPQPLGAKKATDT